VICGGLRRLTSKDNLLLCGPPLCEGPIGYVGTAREVNPLRSQESQRGSYSWWERLTPGWLAEEEA
jgi:hypothetical protein